MSFSQYACWTKLVNSALLLDPVGTITGYGDGGLTTDTITLTYSF